MNEKSKMSPAVKATVIGAMALSGLTPFTGDGRRRRCCGICRQPIMPGDGYRTKKDVGDVHTTCDKPAS